MEPVNPHQRIAASVGTAGATRSVRVKDLDAESVVVRSQRINSTWVAQLCETPSQWPPILATEELQVLDGHHRVEAARRLRRDEIDVIIPPKLCSAGALEAAVSANATHGLSLSRAERNQLIDRLLSAAPHWSDRRIAAAVRVSPTTVGKRRRAWSASEPGEPGVHIDHPGRRLGRDGKSYPARGANKDAPASMNRWARVIGRLRTLLNRLRALAARL